ncbi:MAG: PhnD/SsuA/transferrin family substrate-binding protein, partial [Nitrospinae bacterium]|nr:PhnD/SsuA/transferrin family substrate-binding protein [Nitrospinota bacterium]
MGRHSRRKVDVNPKDRLKDILDQIPKRPGIYIMKDGKGGMLYIGKAKSLFHRVRSYFADAVDHAPRTRIFVRKDSGLKTLADLKGKTIAFTDPISSSGYLYPLDLFKSEGLLHGPPEKYFKRIYFAGGDEQA